IQIGGLHITILPKLPIRRLLFLLAYVADPVRWLDFDTSVTADDEIVDLIAILFGTLARRATGPGLLHDYRQEDQLLHTIRGRLRLGDQIARRFGDRLPVEVTVDEFTADIIENQLLKAATQRLLP